MSAGRPSMLHGLGRGHTFDVLITAGGENRRAACSCGWEGYQRATVAEASDDYRDHCAGRPTRPPTIDGEEDGN